MPLNLAVYETQKKNGSIRMIRVNDDTIAVVTKTFNPHTGDPAPDSIENLSIADIDKSVKALETDLQRMKDLLADLNAVT